jgi:hypothetical protein
MVARPLFQAWDSPFDITSTPPYNGLAVPTSSLPTDSTQRERVLSSTDVRSSW